MSVHQTIQARPHATPSISCHTREERISDTSHHKTDKLPGDTHFWLTSKARSLPARTFADR